MSYWLGRWRWWLSPERFKAAIAATIPKVALEYTIAIEAPTTLKDYAEITAPTLLIKGSKTRAPTRAVVDLLRTIEAGARVLMVLGSHNEPLERSARNLPEVRVILAANLSVRDLLTADTVLMTRDALEHVEGAWS